MTSTPCAANERGERAQRLDLVFLLLLGVGKAQINAALDRLAFDGIGVGRAPTAFGADLRKADGNFGTGLGACAASRLPPERQFRARCFGCNQRPKCYRQKATRPTRNDVS